MTNSDGRATGSPMRGSVLFKVVLIALAYTAAISAQGSGTLTNSDVIKMVKAELSTTIIVSTIEASNASFDLTPAGLIALKQQGVSDELIQAMQTRARALAKGETTDPVTRTAPEKSELLANSRDPEFVLRNFKTMLVDASQSVYFGNAQMKAALGKDKGFTLLKISIVDDSAVADVVLNVNYTFAWDYPFTITHQTTSVVLLSGKGTGPFSGPAGADSVASEFVKSLKPYRLPAAVPADRR